MAIWPGSVQCARTRGTQHAARMVHTKIRHKKTSSPVGPSEDDSRLDLFVPAAYTDQSGVAHNVTDKEVVKDRKNK